MIRFSGRIPAGIGHTWIKQFMRVYSVISAASDSLKPLRSAIMKELRPRGGNLRVLFVFDPRRTAILLLGGDKTGRWQSRYNEAIPRADDLYDEHLAMLKAEGLIP
jgi:hypothetical protein